MIDTKKYKSALRRHVRQEFKEYARKHGKQPSHIRNGVSVLGDILRTVRTGADVINTLTIVNKLVTFRNLTPIQFPTRKDYRIYVVRGKHIYSHNRCPYLFSEDGKTWKFRQESGVLTTVKFPFMP